MSKATGNCANNSASLEEIRTAILERHEEIRREMASIAPNREPVPAVRAEKSEEVDRLRRVAGTLWGAADVLRDVEPKRTVLLHNIDLVERAVRLCEQKAEGLRDEVARDAEDARLPLTHPNFRARTNEAAAFEAAAEAGRFGADDFGLGRRVPLPDLLLRQVTVSASLAEADLMPLAVAERRLSELNARIENALAKARPLVANLDGGGPGFAVQVA